MIESSRDYLSCFKVIAVIGLLCPLEFRSALMKFSSVVGSTLMPLIGYNS